MWYAICSTSEKPVLKIFGLLKSTSYSPFNTPTADATIMHLKCILSP